MISWLTFVKDTAQSGAAARLHTELSLPKQHGIYDDLGLYCAWAYFLFSLMINSQIISCISKLTLYHKKYYIHYS